MDHLSKAGRSRVMASIRSKHTTPELVLRKALRALGLPHKIHVKTLPGCPDIVLQKARLAIWVHGCFWHHHHCRGGCMPQTNSAYWKPKIERTIRRDLSNKRKLNRLGWRNMVIWECQIESPQKLAKRIATLKSIVAE